MAAEAEPKEVHPDEFVGDGPWVCAYLALLDEDGKLLCKKPIINQDLEPVVATVDKGDIMRVAEMIFIAPFEDGEAGE